MKLDRWPLEKIRITSRFGNRTLNGVSAFHYGIDLASPIETPVFATMRGEVINSYMSNSYGNRVIVKHANGLVTSYNHLNSRGVETGETVESGAIIGLSGNTGFSTGPHLHFDVKVSGAYVDPELYLPSLTPVEKLSGMLGNATIEDGLILTSVAFLIVGTSYIVWSN